MSDAFQKFIANERRARPRFARVRARNPFADDLATDLNKHLETVRRWVEGSTWSTKMLDAMIFFNSVFPGKYQPTAGKKVYRGQSQEIFDGSPRSYSYSKKHAEAFAINTSECEALTKQCTSFVVERKVCFACQDKKAFSISIDLAKILRHYALNKYGDEKEVVLLNTRPSGSATLWTVELASA